MKIVLDIMGSDDRPVPDVAGGVLAAREFGDTIIMVGPKATIEAELRKYPTAGLKIEIVDATEEIAMHDKPSLVMKTKPQSSMHIGMNLVKEGLADGFVTMGNTGAAHAIATLSTLRRIPGVKRPALTAIYPILNKEVIFLDVGANADSKVDWLAQYAVMGSAYAASVFNREKPRVATLSNGEEEGKGNQLVKDAQDIIRSMGLNYIGHIEPKEITLGNADVIVMDGFVGNVFIKTFEAAISYFTNVIREELKANLVSSIGGVLARPAFRRVRSRIDTNEVGGAPLLGVNGVVIIGHGSSTDFAVKSAINQARMAIKGRAVEQIRIGIENFEKQFKQV